jgi:GntR family transcriptional regulator
MGPDPLKEQIAEIIAARINDGTYELQRAIPGELALADEFGVSRNTVRAGIAILAEQKLVRVVRGKGTFAVAKPEPPETESTD